VVGHLDGLVAEALRENRTFTALKRRRKGPQRGKVSGARVKIPWAESELGCAMYIHM
jgi:hypothetical protein